MQSTAQTEQFSNNGLTDVVQWDNYSLIVKDQRIFLHSGEFHAFRVPVPDLWFDVFQKIHAAGLNAISVYVHWGLSNPSKGVIDFDDWRDLQSLFDAAKAAGLFIVLRPGPYINAETTAGGIAHWVTSEVAGQLRTNASDFEAAWKPYINAIIDVTKPNQVTEGGPVIERSRADNEYFQSDPTHGAYFAQLEETYIQGGIVVPLTYNDPGQGKNFINGTGAVDIYGLDSYPQGFDCSDPETWSPVTTNYHQYHESVNPSQPWYFPEFQGGAFDPWGPNSPGYDNCFQLTGPDFQQVFYHQLWASNAKLISYYMLYGGTSWGAIPFHGVYTSYDYGSAIRENRALSTKYSELKSQGLFLRSTPSFRKTDWIGDSSTNSVNITNSAVFGTFLRNPDTNTGFYITRQTDSTSSAVSQFKITVSTSSGPLQIPLTTDSIVLNGRESKILVTDYQFGLDSLLLYSTASILFAGTIGPRDVLLLYSTSNESSEASITFTGTPNDFKITSSKVQVHNNTSSPYTTVTFLQGIQGLITIWDSDTQLVLFADSDTAATFFAPVIPETENAQGGLGNYWQFGSNRTTLVGGPYLVRNATIQNSHLALWGDLNNSVTLTVITEPTVTSISWNGMFLGSPLNSSVSKGFFTASLQKRSSIQSIPVPQLQSWKFSDSLPEIQADFSDADWKLANHTSTNSPFKPYYGDGRVLYGCDYGFCENIVIFRGHFNATGAEKSANLSVNGGEAFATSVWINQDFIKTAFGNSSNNENILEEIDDVFTFPAGSVKKGQDNVITVIYDNMGLNETQGSPETSKSPRGIRGFKLNDGSFGEWKVQGKLGGYTNYPDKVRGIFNEGGTFGERSGWHLPGFDTSKWQSRSLSSGLPNQRPGVGFFVTTFKLNIPDDLDVALSFVFDNGSQGQSYRATLFVNGWFMGKRVANLGPQSKFPVHQGILNYSGTNTVAVLLWALEPNTGIAPELKLVVDGVIDGGIGPVSTNNPAWSPRNLKS
ncbi:glycoside hydrolase family 35 protein [Sistotremastrum niveocremeum HHB9708]|uniref:beta-galactosidase n=1 Tax=Sistotremastrum niveocremeum HHB9708 TaxID=1314777 RepID=A0A164UG85_9AGAM|nr:glycoside hydrolase family 35 protein [Sistotremastrum niveocremeum HHB9708]